MAWNWKGERWRWYEVRTLKQRNVRVNERPLPVIWDSGARATNEHMWPVSSIRVDAHGWVPQEIVQEAEYWS